MIRTAMEICKSACAPEGSKERPKRRGYVWAVAAALAALLLRFSLDGDLPPGFPYLTFFPAVVLTTFVYGTGPGVACAILSGLFAWYFFIPPFNSFALDGHVAVALGLYAFVVGVDIALIHVLQRTAVRLRQSQTAAQDLSEQNDLFQMALRAADAGTWTYDVASRRARLSPEAARQHGLGDREVEIDIDRQWRPTAHPDDASRATADLQQAIETCATYQTEFRVRRPDGAFRWLTAIGRVLPDERGHAFKAIGLTLDVTERRRVEEALAKSERLYRLLAENVSDLIVVDDLTGVRSYVSPTSLEFTGYMPEELHGQTPVSLAHPDDVPIVEAAFASLASGAHNRLTCTYRMVRKDGRLIWVEVKHQLVRDRATGAPVQVICIKRDVTERHARTEELRLAMETAEAAKDRADQASQAKTDFLAAMSHEIRTPLNAIIGFTSRMAESGRLDPDMQRHAELVRTAGSALLTVVNDILDFSKVEAGEIALDPRPFAPAALAAKCVSIMRDSAERKGLTLDLHVDGGLPETVLGDEARIRQVLLNLLNNAVKFTRSGSVMLTVKAGHDNRGFYFAIADTGIGIPETKRDRLFTRFSQVDGSIERQYGGTGLGLAISNALVRLMSGEIGVESVDGLGSTFWFSLDLPKVDHACDAAVPLQHIGAPARGRLLLVEDNAMNQELARLVLEQAGHVVVTVGDGEAAVRAVQEDICDLVLMDVQMPGMDGLSATRAIRRLPVRETLPIIGMSASVLPSQVKRYLEAGMDDHVGKPFEPDHLLETVARWLPRVSSGSVPLKQTNDRIFDAGRLACLSKMIRPERLRELLAVLTNDLVAAFETPLDHQAGRIQMRQYAHTLKSATALVGLLDLSQALTAIELIDEDGIVQHGDAKFQAAVASARQQANAAVAMIKSGATPDEPLGKL